MSVQRSRAATANRSQHSSGSKLPSNFWDCIENSNQHLQGAISKSSDSEIRSPSSVTEPISIHSGNLATSNARFQQQQQQHLSGSNTHGQDAQQSIPSRTSTGGSLPLTKTTTSNKENMQPNTQASPSNRYELTYRSKPSNKERCKIQDCTESFDGPEALKKHKWFAHSDCWCEKCNLDFNSYKELIEHKIGSKAHFACGIDGLEFRSESGLKRHIEQAHPIITPVNCPGCKKFMISASALMEHFEDDECPAINVDQFMKLRVDRTIRGITADNDELETGGNGEDTALTISQAGASNRDPSALASLTGGDEDNDFDFDEDVSARRFTAHEKGKGRANMASMPPFDLESEEEEPVFESQPGTKLTEAALLRNMPVKSEDIRHLLQIMWGAFPMSGSSNMFDVSGSGGGNATSPWSEYFDAELFRGPDRFLHCPEHLCKKVFTKPEKLRAHMKTASHAHWFIRCPACWKSVHQVSQLIAHFEFSGLKCKVKDQPWFDQMLEIASGGLVGYEWLGPEGGHRLIAKLPQDVRW